MEDLGKDIAQLIGDVLRSKTLCSVFGWKSDFSGLKLDLNF